MTETHYLRKGDLVVVTGAAQGIGRAIAIRLAADGARLALWDILPEGLAETAELCRAKGANVSSAHVDTVDVETIDAAAMSLAATPFGLVNNAAIFPRATVIESDVNMWRRVLDVNVIGYVLCAKAVVPKMLGAGRGALVNISSGVGLSGLARSAHYSASKAGVLGFTKSLALEVAPAIRVNAVLPGLTPTAQPLADMTMEELMARKSRVPLGRIAEPEDIAGVVSFLMGRDARFMTGQTLAVDGGASMR